MKQDVMTYTIDEHSLMLYMYRGTTESAKDKLIFIFIKEKLELTKENVLAYLYRMFLGVIIDNLNHKVVRRWQLAGFACYEELIEFFTDEFKYTKKRNTEPSSN